VEQEPPARIAGAASLEAWFGQGARALDRLLERKRPLVVGVFEDEAIELVNEIADEAGLDLVQFAGSESWADCALANRQVIKVVRPEAHAVDPLSGIESRATAVMIDASHGS